MNYCVKLMLLVFIFFIFISTRTYSSPLPIQLTGHNLTIDDVIKVARENFLVEIDKKAFRKVQRSNQLLLLAAQKNLPIYGLNRGVGINKDKTIYNGNILTPEVRRLSERFNLNDLYATSAGIGPDAPREIVRAAMLARLNTLLLGHAGVQPEVVIMFADLLNHDITPIIPSHGSIGEADITLLAPIGLAMMGQGDVVYKRQKMSAKTALKRASLKPLHLYAKDALSIFSSNAYTAGMAALATYDLRKLMDKYDLLTALSLEGINGNIAPFMEDVQKLRPYPEQETSAQQIKHYLHGSYLFEITTNRALQDALSFRTASQVSGATRHILQSVQKDLTMQLNSSDDNPAVIIDVEPRQEALPQEKTYYVSQNELKGAVIPTANFEPIQWVLNIERLNIALAHLSASATQRIIKLSSLCVNQLSRFLAPDQNTIAFAAMQKPIIYLNTKIQHQSMPVSTVSYPVAGEIEDTATNSLLVVQNLRGNIENLYQMMGFELIHASQAFDLRKLKNPELSFGTHTKFLQSEFRKKVPFLKRDRKLTPDINNAFNFIKRFDITSLQFLKP